MTEQAPAIVVMAVCTVAAEALKAIATLSTELYVSFQLPDTGAFSMITTWTSGLATRPMAVTFSDGSAVRSKAVSRANQNGMGAAPRYGQAELASLKFGMITPRLKDGLDELTCLAASKNTGLPHSPCVSWPVALANAPTVE